MAQHNMQIDGAAVYKAYQEEADRRGAEILNFGLSSDETGLVSKTTHGFLGTEISGDGKISHQWV